MEKHQLELKKAVIGIVRAVADILGIDPPGVKIKFDDSVTRNRSDERERFFSFVKSGFFPFSKYLEDFEGYSHAEAQAAANTSTEVQS